MALPKTIIVSKGGTGATTLTGYVKGTGTSALTASATIPFSDLSTTPTTLAGYGITDAQPLDSDLTAIAALATTGVIVRTGAGTVATRTFTAGAGISISNGDGVAGNPVITNTSTGLTPNEITAATVALVVNNSYIMNRATLITATLPATAAIGDVIRIVGKGVGLYLVAQNAGQTIHFGNLDSTTGAAGSWASSLRYDCMEFECITVNTDFVVFSSVGSFTKV